MVSQQLLPGVLVCCRKLNASCTESFKAQLRFHLSCLPYVWKKTPSSSASNLAESWNAGNMFSFPMKHNWKYIVSESIKLELLLSLFKMERISKFWLHLPFYRLLPISLWSDLGLQGCVMRQHQSHQVTCASPELLGVGQRSPAAAKLLLHVFCLYDDLKPLMSCLTHKFFACPNKRHLGMFSILISCALDSLAGLGAKHQQTILLYYNTQSQIATELTVSCFVKHMANFVVLRGKLLEVLFKIKK